MIRKFCIETFDRSLRDITKCDLPFGGKCVVFGSDFRQIPLVIPNADRAIIIDVAINSSHL